MNGSTGCQPSPVTLRWIARRCRTSWRSCCDPASFGRTTGSCPSHPMARPNTGARTLWNCCQSLPHHHSFGSSPARSVHESTFYKRDEGPSVIVLAGRSWKTNHLDWKRRIAYVEFTEEHGRSRWLGEGQFLSYRVCQSTRRLLADDADQPIWSRRATAQLTEIRMEYPWAFPPCDKPRDASQRGGSLVDLRRRNSEHALRRSPTIQGRNPGGQLVVTLSNLDEIERGPRLGRRTLGRPGRAGSRPRCHQGLEVLGVPSATPRRRGVLRPIQRRPTIKGNSR